MKFETEFLHKVQNVLLLFLSVVFFQVNNDVYTVEQ